MLTQTGRPARLTTPLAADKLVLASLTGEEAMSSPYRFQLEMLSLDHGVDPATILRKPVSVALDLPGGRVRHFHGIVSRFAHRGRRDDVSHYSADVVPTLWLLSLTRDNRIFQNKTVPDILKQVLSDAGITDVSYAIQGTFEPREYCVQYGESTLAFFQRLCEDEGIFYLFKHEAGKHTLVVTNRNDGIPDTTPTAASVPFAETPVPGQSDVVTRFEREATVYPGKVAVRDFHFAMPDRQIESTLGSTNEEVYDYPVPFAVRLGAEPGKLGKAAPELDRAARLRLEMAESLRNVVHGESTARALVAGHRVTLTGHFAADANGKYFLLAVKHAAENGGWRAGDTHEFRYENEFTAVAIGAPFRPPLRTPRPRMHGTQTAMVVGPPGEEMYVDKYSRVKVQFHWDRAGKKDAGSSCWVRVASTWAGKQWGAIQIPRIGQEVVIDFLDGDPDQPIVIGSVYNAEQMPPYALPDNKTQSGMKSRSSLRGAAADFNELRFEDKKGSEEIYLHAQKDFNQHVEHNETVKIQQHRTVTLTADGADKKGDDKLTLTKGDQVVTLTEGNQTTVLTKGNQSITLTQGNVDETLDKGNRSLTIKDGNRTATLQKGNDEVSLAKGDVKVALSKGNYTTSLTSGNHEVKVTKGNASTEVTQGNVSVKSVAGKVIIEAMQELTLKVGTSTVTVKPTGIEMKLGPSTVALTPAGVDVKGLKVSVAGTAMTEVKGAMTQINGQAMLKMQGAITMIN